MNSWKASLLPACEPPLMTLRSDWTSAGAMVSLTLATALRTPSIDVSRELSTSGVYARTLSNIGSLVTVAEFDGFVHTSRCAGGYSGTEATYMGCYTLNRDARSDKDIPFSV